MQSLKGAMLDMGRILETAKLRQSQTMKWMNTSTDVKCLKCNDEGTLQTFKWINAEGETIDNELIPSLRKKVTLYQVADVITCECHLDRIFDKFNATKGMKPAERIRTFETATIDKENIQWFAQCKEFVENIRSHLEYGTWLYLSGDDSRAREKNKSAFGTGKSYLTHCIGNYLTTNKHRAIYVSEDKLFEDIKSTYSKGSEETESEVLFKYHNVPILLIDDLFKSKTSDWTEDKIFHLLNNRQRPGLVTIINSNYSPNRIELTMPKNGRAIASRIIEQSIMIEMIGTDRRREIGKKRWQEGMGV